MSKTEKTPKWRSDRVFRGGSSFRNPHLTHVASRFSAGVSCARYGLGFRLLEVLDEQD
jgi:formylglycine-generating enzyme required for sulfatase activity